MVDQVKSDETFDPDAVPAIGEPATDGPPARRRGRINLTCLRVPRR
jgi:hypothetical protein